MADVPSIDVQSQDFAHDRAVCSHLFLSSLSTSDASLRKHAELDLRKAQGQCPYRFVLICAEELGDDSKPACARQLAGVLLVETFSRFAQLQIIRDLSISCRAALHAALERALQSDDRLIRSAAAAGIAGVARFEVPLGLWSELIPSLQQWTADPSPQVKGDCMREGALMVIKGLAQDWPSEQLIPCLISIAAKCMDKVFSSRTRVLAMEAILQILETTCDYAADATPDCPDIVVAAVLSGCQAEEPRELQMTSFHCLEHLCREFDILSFSWKQVLDSCFKSVTVASMPVKILVMDLSCTAINSLPSSVKMDNDFQTKIAPQLLQVVLGAARHEVMLEGSASMLAPARNCLSAICSVAPTSCVPHLKAFASNHLDSERQNLQVVALISFGSVLPNLGPEAEHLVGLAFATILKAMHEPQTCAAACWAAGRVLEFNPHSVPESCKTALFAMCLQGLAFADYADDFNYVMLALLASLSLTPDQFSVMSHELLKRAEGCGVNGCGFFVSALALLTTRTKAEYAQDFCNVFGQLVTTLIRFAERLQAAEAGKDPSLPSEERRICWDGSECTHAEFTQYYKSTAERAWMMSPVVGRAEVVPGVSKCLHMLTDRLGKFVGHVAEQMLAYYIGNLQVTCSRGGGLDEDTLHAIGALACQLGPNFLNVASHQAALWPLLLHGAGEPAATSSDLATWELFSPCKASLMAFCNILDAIGSGFAQCGHVAQAYDNMLRLLQVRRLHYELRAWGLRVLGRLVFSAGDSTKSFPHVLAVLHQRLVELHRTGSQAGFAQVRSFKASAARAPELQAAFLVAYTYICLGLRNIGRLDILTPQVPDLLQLLARCVCTQSKEVLEVAVTFTKTMMSCYPEDASLVEECQRNHELLISAIATELTKTAGKGGSGDAVGDVELSKLLKRCMLK